MFEDLNKKNILVIGASKGIGKSLVEALNSSFDCNIYAVSRSSTSTEAINETSNFKQFNCDITNPDEVNQFTQSLSNIHGVAFVAGLSKLIPPKLLNLKMIQKLTDVNFNAPLNFLGSLLKNNALSDDSSIIFTSASARINQVTCSAPYAGAKLGLFGAARSLAADLSSKKIRVNCVSFDYVATDMIKDVVANDDDIIGISPPNYAAIPYLFLLSNYSRWITGQMIAADAGRMLGKARYV